MNFNWVLLFLCLLWLNLWLGCTAFFEKRALEEEIIPIEKWSLQNYSEFLKQNIRLINEKYSIDYIRYNFVVDVDRGSTVIQSLIDPVSVSPFVNRLPVNDLEDKEKAWLIYNYLLEEYDYTLDPFHWPRVDETIKTKKGDCKGLSLLLMSMWLSAGIDAYAAIANGHMWTNVYYDNEWHLFEVDKDPQRSKIYNIPGFYEYPLFKIYKDQTYKRKQK